LDGLRIAVQNIDEVVEIIKKLGARSTRPASGS
jgi:DNA gyrase/topoisomerase IV subunit A